MNVSQQSLWHTKCQRWGEHPPTTGFLFRPRDGIYVSEPADQLACWWTATSDRQLGGQRGRHERGQRACDWTRSYIYSWTSQPYRRIIDSLTHRVQLYVLGCWICVSLQIFNRLPSFSGCVMPHWDDNNSMHVCARFRHCYVGVYFDNSTYCSCSDSPW